MQELRCCTLSIDRNAAVALNANRLVTGVLRGFDQFMNIVLDNTVDEKSHTDIGMVVRSWLRRVARKIVCLLHATAAFRSCCVAQVIRGNSIVTVEVLERL